MTKNSIVCNAGPLIYLSIIGRFNLLKDLFDTVFVPEAVFEEVVIMGKGKPGEKEVIQALEEGWLVKASIKNRLAVQGMLDQSVPKPNASGLHHSSSLITV